MLMSLQLVPDTIATAAHGHAMVLLVLFFQPLGFFSLLLSPYHHLTYLTATRNALTQSQLPPLAG